MPLDDTVYIADVLAPFVDSQDEVFHCPADVPGRIPRDPPNTGKSWFQSERSSYEYRVGIAGRTMTEVANRFEQFGMIFSENTIWVIRDFHNFHGDDGDQRRRNYLFIDGHVSDFENF
jgi:prepilin-type processing-associated H-X9-DG protein